MNHITIAALFVDPSGVYSGIEGVDPWGEDRDAMTYSGDLSVVAHPPCSRWCRLAGLVESRWGHKVGDDGGTFAFALDAVRRTGGVLEHPAFTKAWPAHGLPAPPTEGWQRSICGGWVCHVEQGRYGHVAKKATWLYAFGIECPPTLRWGATPDKDSLALVSWCANKTDPFNLRPRVGKAAASRTPEAFRDVLIEIARSSSHPCAR